MKIGAVILAGGRSARFEGGNKLLAEVGGMAMVRRVATSVAASEASEILLVVGADGGAVAAAAGDGRWRTVAAPRAGDGLSASLHAGLEALGSDAAGAMVVLADMPDVSTDLIDVLISAFDMCRGQAIVFPQAPNGRQGHPVIWPRSLFGDLFAVTGDEGGKRVLASHTGFWHPVPVDAAGAFEDIDTVSDLERRTEATDRASD